MGRTVERRQDKRLPGEGMEVQMPTCSHVKIVDISASGGLVMVDRNLSVGNTYPLVIKHRGKTLKAQAIVMRSRFLKAGRIAGNTTTPIYLAGMQFGGVTKEETLDFIK